MRKRFLAFTALAAVTLAALAMSAAPSTGGASAGVAAAGAWCDNGVFSSLSWLTSSGALARGAGGFQREPHLNVAYKELPASAVGKGEQLASVVVVPVWFHIVHDNGVGNVSDADMDRQIRIMNLGYCGVLRRLRPGLPLRARRHHEDGQRRVVQRRS